MAAPSFYSDPHVQFLSQLLEEIAEGFLQVPRFQRPLVWDWDQRQELLASIRDGIPIGAIMVWRTTGAPIECYHHLGPHQLAPPPPNSTRQYLLDGVQRLSTLYGALHREPGQAVVVTQGDIFDSFDVADELEPDSQDFEVFYDLESKEFLTHETNDGNMIRQLMPLNIVFDSVALLRFQRSLRGHNADAAVVASDEIARAFREYKIPIIPITTDDLDMATRTFQRINSQGTQMSELHMVHALTWSSKFDLRRHFADIRFEILLPRSWQDLDDDPILKACKASLGLDIYRTNAEDLSEQLRRNPRVLRDVGEALGRVADFLWEDCGIRSPDFLPYSLQAVLLAEAFRLEPNPSNALRSILSAWFWVTTYGEIFTGMSGDRAQTAVADMRLMVETAKPTWTWNRPFVERPLRPKFDLRSARAKALVFRLAQRQDELLGGRTGTELLAESGRRAVVQVVPWPPDRTGSFSSPANRFLIHPLELPKFKDVLLSGLTSELTRKVHLISPEAARALQQREFRRFADLRAIDLSTYETEFVTPLVELFDPGYARRFEGRL